MPIYEYRCLKCGNRFELPHAVGADPGPCPKCGGILRRVYSSVGVIFKGSGFHSTDYRKPTPATEGESPAKSAGESKQATKDTAPKKTASEPTKGSAAEGKSS